MSFLTGMTGLGVVLAALPAHAQQTAPTTNQQTATPSPTPTPGAVGPPELQNFNLGGTVTREAAPPPAASTPTPTPSPAPASSAPTRDAPPSVTRDAPAPRNSAPAAPTNAAPGFGASTAAPTSADPTAILPTAPQTAPDLMPPAPAAAPTSGLGLWPWLAALAVALAAAAAWWLKRRNEEEQELAYAGYVAPETAPTPEPLPRAAAQPVPQPAPAPAPAPRRPAGPLEGGIVSRGLQPKLVFELHPLKFETDQSQNARLTFELVIANIGSAPARDVRVEAKMFNAGPNQDLEIEKFFRAPGALGAKLPAIPPQDRMPLRSRIGMTPAEYKALMMGGRALVVPMIAVNAVYRGTAGETQDSASWLVGKLPTGAEEAEKLGPFALEKPQSATALAARIHSRGLSR